MSKYTRDELRTMARQALAARERMDEKWTRLLFQLLLRGFTARDAERAIERLAA